MEKKVQHTLVTSMYGDEQNKHETLTRKFQEGKLHKRL